MRSRRYSLTCCKPELTIGSDGHHQLWWADWKSVALVKLPKMEHFPIRFGYLQQQNINQPYPKFRLPHTERNREREFEFKLGDHGLQRNQNFQQLQKKIFPTTHEEIQLVQMLDICTSSSSFLSIALGTPGMKRIPPLTS
jgi:hypothetical protein